MYLVFLFVGVCAALYGEIIEEKISETPVEKVYVEPDPIVIEKVEHPHHHHHEVEVEVVR